MTDTVNSQVTDSVTQTSVNLLGNAPAQSMGMVYQSMAHSISLLMQNSVSAQGGMQQINAAVIASACQKILAAPSQAPRQRMDSLRNLPQPGDSPKKVDNGEELNKQLNQLHQQANSHLAQAINASQEAGAVPSKILELAEDRKVSGSENQVNQLIQELLPKAQTASQKALEALIKTQSSVSQALETSDIQKATDFVKQAKLAAQEALEAAQEAQQAAQEAERVAMEGEESSPEETPES